MRKVVLYTLMSLDGAVDRPDQYFAPAGRLGDDVPEFDAEMIDNETRVIEAQDAVLLGRTSYDEWAQFWPTAGYQPFADFINGVKKYVVTSSPLSRPWRNAEAVDGPVEDLVRDLKERPGGDIGIHASITLGRSLLAAGLVDQLELVVGPAFGFTGRRLFPGTDQIRRLELRDAASTSSGSLLLTYRLP